MSDLWDYDGAECSDSNDSVKEKEVAELSKKKRKMYLEVEEEKNSPSPAPECPVASAESMPYGSHKKSKPSVADEPSTSQQQMDKAEEPDINEEAKKQQMYLEACVHEFDEFLEEAARSVGNPEEIKDLSGDSDGDDEAADNHDKGGEHPEEEIFSDSIILVCQDGKKNSTKVRIRHSECFESLFERYCKHALEKGWANEKDKIKFYFDGERIQTTDAPEDLGCENEDTIDVHITAG